MKFKQWWSKKSFGKRVFLIYLAIPLLIAHVIFLYGVFYSGEQGYLCASFDVDTRCSLVAYYFNTVMMTFLTPFAILTFAFIDTASFMSVFKTFTLETWVIVGIFLYFISIPVVIFSRKSKKI